MVKKKSLPANAGDIGDMGSIPSREDPLKEGMATQCSILIWRIAWTEEPGRLQPMGSQRVIHDRSDLARTQLIFSVVLVSGVQQSDSDIYVYTHTHTHIYILFHILFHYDSSQDAEYSCLCYTLRPVDIIFCIC